MAKGQEISAREKMGDMQSLCHFLIKIYKHAMENPGRKRIGKMENRAILTGVTDEVTISGKSAVEFLRLYEESVLLSLLEQGVLNEVQFQLCMEKL